MGDVCDVLDGGFRSLQAIDDELNLCEIAVGSWALQAIIQRNNKLFVWPEREQA